MDHSQGYDSSAYIPYEDQDSRVFVGNGLVPPVLTPGVYSIRSHLNLNRANERFFENKEIPEDHKVRRVLRQQNHPDIASYTEVHRDALLLLPYAAYMKRISDVFLPPHWEDDYRFTLTQRQGDMAFSAWTTSLKTTNNCLTGSPNHYSDDDLRRHFRVAMNETLRDRYLEYCKNVDLELVTNLDEWIRQVNLLAIPLERRRQVDGANWGRNMAAAGNTPSSGSGGSLLNRVTPRHLPGPTSYQSSPYQSRAASQSVNRFSAPSSAMATSGSYPSSGSTMSRPANSRSYPPLMSIYNALPSHLARPPPLTDNWKRYLLRNKGCFRCRKIFVHHLSSDCDMERNINPRNWSRMLSDDECAPLLRAWQDRRRENQRVAAVVAEPEIVTSSIEDLEAEFAAAQQDEEKVGDSYLDGSTDSNTDVVISPVWDTDDTDLWSNSDHPNQFVGAVMYSSTLSPVSPSLRSSIVEGEIEDFYGPDEDSYLFAAVTEKDVEDFDPDAVLLDEEYVSNPSIPPPRDHLLWTCHLLGPASHARVQALIDHGCPTVLISSHLVHALDLRLIPLESPLSLGGVGGGKFACSHFVKLRIRSLDNSWTAQHTRALVVPNIPFDIILGLEWLKANKIVVDMSNRSVLAKSSGYHLLRVGSVPEIRRSSYVPSITSTVLRRGLSNAPARHNFDARRQLVDRSRRLLRRVLVQLQRTTPRLQPIPDALLCFSVIRSRISILAAAMSRSCAFQRAEDDVKSAFNDVFLDVPVNAVPPKPFLHTDGTLRVADSTVKSEFSDLFPERLPHVDTLPHNICHRIVVTAVEKICTSREYTCPRKWREDWKKQIEEHLRAGRIRPSSSPFASPSFLVPKADSSASPRWVIDYRRLNAVTIPDRFPLPRIDDILADCAKGKIWAKIDMTSAFFQTRMHPDNIKYTACRTPFGLYEWNVMPMGLRNSPSTQQRRVTNALRHLIGDVCHVYLDDIVIWSDTLEQHAINVRKVLEALRNDKLFCSLKKSHLFCDDILFLGHKISRDGIEADPSKVDKILAWPRPRNATEVRRFLGLVRFVGHYLPNLSAHTHILYHLTTKEADKCFPVWSPKHQTAFDAIKELVTSRISFTCDASNSGTGAILSWGPSWKDSRPVAFDSQHYSSAQRHYPTHEQELLAVIRSLKKWRSDLLGMHVEIYTDHKTLLNFDTQKDLSRRQARWMEFLSQYDYNFNYIAGTLNTAADALSRMPPDLPVEDPTLMVASTFLSLSASVLAGPASYSESEKTTTAHRLKLDLSNTLLRDIRNGYASDRFVLKLKDAMKHGSNVHPGFQETDGLLFYDGRIVIPNVASLRERLFYLAHDQLGHFGVDKSYDNLRSSFYWPNMRRDLEKAYVPSCESCQMNKSTTSLRSGPLHPLPIPDERFASIAIDFIGPLPLEHGFDFLATITDRLGADIKLIPCKSSTTAEDFAQLFLDNWVCDNGCPREIVSDRDSRFLSKFWQTLTSLLGINHITSSAFHPQTDGSSERTNKTVIQCLRFFVDRNQKGWVNALPRVRFNIMSSINASTRFSGFQLKTGFSPRLFPVPPPLDSSSTDEVRSATLLLNKLRTDVFEAKDNLLAAKVVQAYYANDYRADDPGFKVGDRVLLNTTNRRREYMHKGSGRAAKFMPRFDGPFQIVKAHPESSSYTLSLPPSATFHPTFHVSQLRRFIPNDDTAFPSRKPCNPEPTLVDGDWEHVIERIIDERQRGRGKQYLVRWKGFSSAHDEWIPHRLLRDNVALDEWETRPPDVPTEE
ncbi:hypothetical protein Agabi119p4_2621 [Agaricus bisporus var. burnettii]|uniref:RNA-directed DNA polymerase n=1 Tax=Agaricus bisporus var. burnettii TaxID=192524 RepID=A0A8H7F9G2_AGABI|nr:hypothetical protein Agabi119p4_2621 [Agaricus bisporus var. burnettii]